MEDQLIFTPELAKQIVKFLKDSKDPTLKHSRYESSVDHAEEMSWHVYGSKPVKLLEKTRPREEAAIRDYRIQSYQPITKPICKKALKVVYKIFSPNLYSIRFPETTEGAKLHDYTMENYPVFNSVVNYLSDFLLKKTIADPNAVLLVEPSNYILSGVEYVAPITTCYSSKDVHLVSLVEDHALLFDKEVKTDSGVTVWYYTWVTKNTIQKLILEVNSEGSLLVTVADEYSHQFGSAPFWFLGGEYSDMEQRMYESFFFDAVPFWNKAIDEDSDVDGAYRMHLWPQKWEVTDECEYVEDGLYPCQGGYVFNQEKGSKHKCPNCGGAGFKTAKGPYETHMVNKDRFVNPDGALALQVPLGYITVPTDATKMLEDKVDRNLNQGLRALNMDVMEEIGLNQSGKAKEMDRTELNQFLQRITDQFYEIHLTNIFYFSARYIFNTDKLDNIVPEVSKPTSFDIYSTSELTQSLAQSKTAKLSPSYIRVKQSEIVNREFQTNPKLLQQMNLESDLDSLSEVPRDEVSVMLAAGTVQIENIIIHDNITLFVQRALSENPNFPTLSTEEQREVLLGYAKEVVTANKVTIDKSPIEDESGTDSEQDRSDDNSSSDES